MKIFPGIIARLSHRSETHGIAERAARRVKDGTSAVLLQSGLDEKWGRFHGMLHLSAKRHRSEAILDQDFGHTFSSFVRVSPLRRRVMLRRGTARIGLVRPTTTIGAWPRARPHQPPKGFGKGRGKENSL